MCKSKELYDLLFEKGGFTVQGDKDPTFVGFGGDTFTHYSGDKGYAVSLPEYEVVLSSLVLGHGTLLELVRRLELLRRCEEHPQHTWIGAWYDPQSERVHLDLTVIYYDRGEAAEVARAAGQLAIFDFSSYTTIRMDGRQE